MAQSAERVAVNHKVRGSNPRRAVFFPSVYNQGCIFFNNKDYVMNTNKRDACDMMT